MILSILIMKTAFPNDTEIAGILHLKKDEVRILRVISGLQ